MRVVLTKQCGRIVGWWMEEGSNQCREKISWFCKRHHVRCHENGGANHMLTCRMFSFGNTALNGCSIVHTKVNKVLEYHGIRLL
jgi:hypothetical protein